MLFSIILLIPRLRRLRRRVWAWALLRAVAAGAGGWLAWRGLRGGTEVLEIIPGIILLAFGMFFRAKPEAKPIDDVARDLHALVVLNGGAYFAPGEARPILNVSIFVNPDQLVVLTARGQEAANIPVARLRRLAARAVPLETRTKGEDKAWEVEVTWQSGESYTARFRYEGFFAEHLARVAQQTIESVWKKGLPVLNL